MADTPLSPVLRHIRKLAAAERIKERTDVQLLQEFASHNDQTAFAALVRRHGPMVLGVCRNVLRHTQDAEDAFQATFLVFARKAGTIRKAEALVNWLHGVAYRMAMNAKRNAARRRSHEKQAQPAPQSDPAWETAWREVQALLNEEIQRLPQIYQATFILCCLENKSAAEAGRLLGIKEGTVWSRLAEARKRLQQRLTKRGVTLSAVLAVLALAENKAQATVRSFLVDTTVQAASAYAAGQATAKAVSASVAALVQGATQIMTLSKVKIATALLLAAALLAGGSALVMQPRLAAKPAEKEPVQVVQPLIKAALLAADPDDTKEPLEVSGKVLGPDGKPFAGAKVHVSAGETRHNPVKTDEAGRFQITIPRAELVSRGNKLLAQITVAATAKGYGLDWAIRGTCEPATELTLRLVKDDVPINGRIVSLEGKPVAGAKVRVRMLRKFRNEDLTAYLKEVEASIWVDGGPAELSLIPERDTASEALPWLPTATTDKEGRFRLIGLGRERVAHLSIAEDGIQHWYLAAMTRDAKAVIAPPPRNNYETLYVQLFPSKVHGATFEQLATTARLVQGTVRDKETGKPLADVLVTGLLTESWARTDSQGHYELKGYPKSEKYDIMAIPDQQGVKGRPRQAPLYFHSSVEVPDKLGLDPIVANLEMSRGILLLGKLTDKVTGKPVPGRVSYYPLRPNENVRDVPGLANIRNFAAFDAEATYFGAHSIDEAAADGSFQCLVLPGPGAVCVQASSHYQVACVDPRTFFNDNSRGTKYHLMVQVGAQGGMTIDQEKYQAIALIKPDKGTNTITHDIALEPARKIKGIVLGPDGKPLPGARARNLQETAGSWEELGESSEFSMFLPHPERPRTLIFRHEDKRLVGQLPVTSREENLTVRLEPWGTVEGRLLAKAEGEPLAGVRVHHSPSAEGNLGFGLVVRDFPTVMTGKDGRFILTGLIPGKTYTLRFTDDRDPKIRTSPRGNVVKELTLKTGETKNLGNIVAVYDTKEE